MKTFISIGDFVDFYFKLRVSNLNKFLPLLIPSSSKKRTTKAWNSASSFSQTNWWSIPAVQKRWNKLITGDANLHYFKYLVDKYLSERSNLKLLSPGCGTGEKELKFAQFSNFSSIDAFDLSPQRIKVATETAEKRGVKNVHFIISDSKSFNYKKNYYDVILFDSFLHHIKNLDEILSKIYFSLKKNGIFIINEYVGPNRFQWSSTQLKTSNKALKELPQKFRKRFGTNNVKSKIYKPGIIRMILSDPSEAIKSESILLRVKERFNVLEEKPYGGNILHLTLKDISQNFIIEDDETLNLLDELFVIEDEFLKNSRKSNFIFGVYSRLDKN